MAQDAKDNRIVISGDKARDKLLEGAKALYDVVGTSYGPKGRNILAEKPFGRPLLTRDGVTISRETYFKDRAKNMGAQVLLEASETTNQVAGDGTSATVVLGYYLMKHGMRAIAAGVHPMNLRDMYNDDASQLLRTLKKLSKPVKKNQLQQVATVSSGDDLLGQLIAEAIERVGQDGGIITEKYPVANVEREYIDGYYLQAGFEALQAGKKEMIDPTAVIVSSRRMSSSVDAVDLLNSVMRLKGLERGQVPRVLFIGEFSDAAYQLIVGSINAGQLDAIIIKTPPSFAGMSKDLLEDIAIYANCDVITDTTIMSELNERYLGTIDRVVANKTESTLFADSKDETIRDRVAKLKEQIDAEVSDAVSEKLKDRVAKLEGKVALFKIGGATDTEKEEKEFRVEDAVQATRAAYEYGVVPGGGVTLLRMATPDISDYYRDALYDTFKKLIRNAGLPADVMLNTALGAKAGEGFNLRAGSELVDMIEAGILDPTKVIEQVITNATAAVANALTTNVLLIFEDRKEK